MEAGSAAPGSGNGEPYHLNLGSLLSLYRQPSGADQLQSAHSLRSMSRSLSLTLPWEVGRLSRSLQPQQSLVNQGLLPAQPAAAAGRAAAEGEAGPLGPAALFNASWHDIQQLRLESCLNAREQELDAAAGEQLSEEAKLAALIEAKKLKLVGLQRELRQEILTEQRLAEGSSLTQLLDWSRWRRPPPGRLAGFVPPKLPAVEVQRRLLMDPETARRVRQQALQQWAAQHLGQAQQAVQRAGSFNLSQQATLRADSLATHLQGQDGQKARSTLGGGSQAAGGAATAGPAPAQPPRKRTRRSASPQQGRGQHDGGDAGGGEEAGAQAHKPLAEDAIAAAAAAFIAEAGDHAAREEQQQQRAYPRRVRWGGGGGESDSPGEHDGENEEAPGSAAEAEQQRRQQGGSRKRGRGEAEGGKDAAGGGEERARSCSGSPTAEGAAGGGDGDSSGDEGWDVPVMGVESIDVLPPGAGAPGLLL